MASLLRVIPLVVMVNNNSNRRSLLLSSSRAMTAMDSRDLNPRPGERELNSLSQPHLIAVLIDTQVCLNAPQKTSNYRV